MFQNDFDKFRGLLDRAATVYSKPKPNDELVSMYWDSLKDLHIAAVERGINSHLKYQKFFPKPAELRPKDEKKGSDPVAERIHASVEKQSIEMWERMKREDPKKYWRLVIPASLDRVRIKYAHDADQLDHFEGRARDLWDHHVGGERAF